MAKISTLPAECELPQLHEIVDPKRLAVTLQKHLSETDSRPIQVTACKIDHLYYKPGGDCRLLFTANLRKQQNGTDSRQLFFGKIFPSGKAKHEFDALNLEKMSRPSYGPPAMYIPEWETVLWAFPNDPKLPGLGKLVDSESVLAEIQSSPDRFGMDGPPQAITARQTKYVPGRRCGFIFQTTGPENEGSVYGKAYQPEAGEKAYQIMQQIWQSDSRKNDELLLPEPYGFDPVNHIIWQEVVPGRPLAKNAGEMHNLTYLGSEIGRRLAAFHNTNLTLPLLMTVDFQLEDLRLSVEKINRLFPQFAEECSLIARELFAAADQLDPVILTPVHASFKFSHIFMTERGIVFIDFDNANLGDPGYDLGRFIAHLYKMKAGGKLAIDIAEKTAANFCNAYNLNAHQPLSTARINWFAASHLLGSQVYKAVKRMNGNAVGRLLEETRQLCQCLDMKAKEAG